MIPRHRLGRGGDQNQFCPRGGAAGTLLSVAFRILWLLVLVLVSGRRLCAETASPRMGDAWSDPRNPMVSLFGGGRLDLWSLRPVAAVSVPNVEAPAHDLQNPVDRFVAARLAREGMVLSPEADRRTLIRRLCLDLTGLPPSPEAVAEFVGDRAPEAYGRLVDRLLASPAYGEHQARLWLDVVRYSDSNGFDWDEFRPRAWRYRDYVIRAFNADLPFDRFIREQLAGDELVSGPPVNAAEQDALLATGYLRMGPHDNAAPLFNEQDRSRAELMSDLVETTGAAFLGLTLGCCRCHDHKFDPLSQADHFRMRAFFEPVTFADDLPLDLAPEQEAIRRHNDGIEARVAPLEQRRDAAYEAARQRERSARIATLSADERGWLESSSDPATGDLKEKRDAIRRRVEPSEKEVLAALSEADRAERERIKAEVTALRTQRRELTRGLLMTDAEGEPPVTRVLFQGNLRLPRQAVEPGFPSVLDPNPAVIRRPNHGRTTGRRLALADWIASPSNPLTARVWVNRVWQQHFGRGLVATANDFGLAGARPTHPELLDWLATDFIQRGGSVKSLHRRIVLSATYRQESGSDAYHRWVESSDSAFPRLSEDADNLLLGRQNLRRLTAEQLRDALLSASGLMDRRAGGTPVWPELPAEVLQANPAFLDDNETRTKGWYPTPAGGQHVRSIYLVQKRTVRVPFMETFDLPENSTSCARRDSSIVAPQALSLLNSPLAVTMAGALAERVRLAGGDPVSSAFQFALQREPIDIERARAARLMRDAGLTGLCRALLNLNEFAFAD